jgi:hypothetical protein
MTFLQYVQNYDYRPVPVLIYESELALVQYVV